MYALEPKFLNRLGEITDRNAKWTLMRHEGILYVTGGGEPVSGPVTRHALAG